MPPELDQPLLQWLGSLPADTLARVIANRPETTGPAWPRHMVALAKTLGAPAATVMAIRRLPTPAVQVIRAIAVLPADAIRGDLANFLGVDVADVDLRDALAQLAEHALVWDGPGGRFGSAPYVRDGWQDLLGLGRPAVDFLLAQDFSRTKGVARLLGLSVGGSREAVIERIIELFRDGGRLDALIESGPPRVRTVLLEFAHDGPIRFVEGIRSYHSDSEETPEQWAARRGLLWARDWAEAEMPREVALALRGPDYHAPFTPAFPPVKTQASDPAVIEAESAALAGHLLDRTGALMDVAARSSIAMIKAGGVGQREVKRLTKVLSCSQDEVRLIVDLVYAAGLLVVADGGLAATDSYTEWIAQPPAVRLRDLIGAWWSTLRSALRPFDNNKPPVLAFQEDGEIVLAVRRAALTVYAGLPTGQSATTVAETVQWLCPLYPPSAIGEVLRSALAEAQLLGLVARDAASGLCRTLVDGGDLVAAAQGLMPVIKQTALFGTDLTAVVTGPPSAELGRLLDRVADRESRGTASLWRFSPVSVRKALDDGATEQQLVADLAEIAEGPLPQPLTYLIKDVGRRHGEVRVAEVSCVVCGSDEALLAEIAAHRKLVRLGLRLLSPTVLASAASLATTLAALRDAGYAPVPADGDATSTIQRMAPAPRQSRSRHVAGPESDVGTPALPGPGRTIGPRELTERLLAAATLTVPMDEYKLRAAIRRHAPRLPPSEQYYLHHLVYYGMAVHVHTTVDDDLGTSWTLEKGELDGEVLHAWCPDVYDYKALPLSTITKVDH